MAADNKTSGDSKEYDETTEGRNKIKNKSCARYKNQKSSMSILTFKLNVRGYPT